MTSKNWGGGQSLALSLLRFVFPKLKAYTSDSLQCLILAWKANRVRRKGDPCFGPGGAISVVCPELAHGVAGPLGRGR